MQSTGKKRRVFAPHIVRFIAHFNKVSMWVASSILQQTVSTVPTEHCLMSQTMNRRVAVMTKLIAVAHHCRILNNFNGARHRALWRCSPIQARWRSCPVCT